MDADAVYTRRKPAAGQDARGTQSHMLAVASDRAVFEEAAAPAPTVAPIDDDDIDAAGECGRA